MIQEGHEENKKTEDKGGGEVLLVAMSWSRGLARSRAPPSSRPAS